MNQNLEISKVDKRHKFPLKTGPSRENILANLVMAN